MSSSLAEIVKQLDQIVRGKQTTIKLAISCLLAKGHLLLEDLPGMGKTTLAHALAKVMGLNFQRVQFTNDLLPSDIIGSAIYRRSDETFKFHKGPIFTQILLADEINRATPKSQSALLEAMEEYQVTSDGVSHPLPSPFFVIATQNPFHQSGTHPLPESQLDRFLMCISLGYPSPQAEKILLQGQDTREQIAKLSACMTAEQLLQHQLSIQQVKATDSLLDYLQSLIDHSRNSSHWSYGLSPRAGIGLLKSAKAWAYLHGRDFTLPEDIQAVWSAVVTHRLIGHSAAAQDAADSVMQLLKTTPIPR